MIPGLRVYPEIGFSEIGGGYLHFDDPSRGKFDTGKFGPAEYFTDLWSWWQGGTITRGVSRHDGTHGRAEAGRATMQFDNTDRRFDPTNLAGPYVAAGVTQVQPEREMRYRAEYGGVTYNLWRGSVDDWRLTYRFPNIGDVAVSGTDGTKIVANHDQNAGGIVGTGETAGARVNRVLDNIGWPATDRLVATGQTTLQGTDLSANAWSELALVSDTEIADLYFDGTGKLVFRHRHAPLTDTRSNTPQATFGDDPGELGYVDLEIEYSADQVQNLIRAARVGGTQQVAQDTASQAAYRTRTWNRSDLIMQTDTDAADWAGFVLALQKDAELRFSSITIDPRSDPANLFPQVLGRELGDRIRILFRPPGGGATIQRDAFIRGISHDLGKSTWRTTWALQDAEVFAFLVFDNAVLGRLDYNAFAY
jgi:hypothetical protein